MVAGTRSATRRRLLARLGALAAAALLVLSLVPASAVAAPVGASAPAPATLDSHTPEPTAVTIAGSLQAALGCSGDWDPACATTHLAYAADDDVWQGTWNVPAGSWEYKVALNDAWDENYGLNATPNGSNIPLTLAADASVKFYYDHKTHWGTDNHTSVIATVPGSFQSELGCAGDWDPGCLRSWLEDPAGTGTYSFETTALPAGSYDAKVAIDEGWDENYGAGGVPGGANIPFTVPVDNAKVTFRYDPATHLLAILAGHAHDNNVEWDGLRHDSRDTLYRTPGGAVESGTPVTLRFRTFHDDVTSVKARFYSLRLGGQRIVPMSIAAAGISCYDPALATETCDWWQLTLPPEIADEPDNLWYRFIVSDGTDTDYYADDTPALDGGPGAASDEVVDQSWALMQFVPGFAAPAWASDAVIYQIFPDRFRNGRKDNDPKTGDLRYDDPVLKLPWGVLPEGYCRNYADASTSCPWRFDDTPPADSPTKESPRGRDYMGGDLRGVDQQLATLKEMGVSAIYFNPIFDAGSNHGYDTQDYLRIDPYFGTQKDWDNLVKHAKALGIRIILDGVFNHLSSDSPMFDRYHHYSTSGACESLTSPYRSWFTFHDVAPGTGTCVGSGGADSATYDGWFGFDSIPVLTKSLPEVQAYFLTSTDSVAKHWLASGASGWRLDVSGDASFPDGYWESFRSEVKATKPDALTISETWQKDSTLLRMLRGDRLDTTMNYRLRDAVIGLLAPGPFDSKGFADSGRVIAPSEFAARLLSIREDYPDAAYFSLMNLLDSHDTERLLWTLTPGAETTADKEGNAANVAVGKLRVRLASLIQFTLAGAPTVYYGDEVGMTGDDDPDDRRTYPWADLGGNPDTALRAHYQALSALRSSLQVLRDGDLRIVALDDDAGVVAYGRRDASRAAIVAVNRSGSARTIDIPLAGFVPDGTAFSERLEVGSAAASATAGGLEVSLPALGGIVLATDAIDLAPPSAPENLRVTAEAASQVSVAWDAVPGAAAYRVYASRLSGGGFTAAEGAPDGATSFTLTGLQNAAAYHVVVAAVDAAGNESVFSNEVSALPHLSIGWANLQWPPSMTHTISAVNRTDNVYGHVWIDGITNEPGPAPSLIAQLGYGPDGSDPDGNANWAWIDASFNVDSGNNDEYVASLLPESTGTFDYAFRYSVTNGQSWLYADLDGTTNGYAADQAGSLTVNPSGDTTPPAVPTGLRVTSASPAAIELAWDPVEGDASLYGYEVLRSTTSGGPYTEIARVAGSASYADTEIEEGSTYVYVVRALDISFNRSATSSEVSATAALRTVTVVFDVAVPATTDGTGLSVHIAGTLDRLDGGLPAWDPGATVMSRVDATHWTITLTGRESTQIEYKYALGDWEHVEKDGVCGEIGNRLLTLTYGSTGTQTVSDVVQNWRNVAPCGN